MSLKRICAKNLRLGDQVYLYKQVWKVINHYGHDVQVRRIDSNMYCILLGNCIYKKVEGNFKFNRRNKSNERY